MFNENYFFQLTKKEGQALRETRRGNMIDDTTYRNLCTCIPFQCGCSLSLSHALFIFLHGLSGNSFANKNVVQSGKDFKVTNQSLRHSKS